MNITKNFEKLEKSQVKLSVTIPQNDVASAYQNTLEKYAKTAQIPGFRKGKVPVNILEAKYGQAVKGDVAGDLMEKALGEIFESGNEYERPLPYALPRMEETPDFDITKDLNFTVIYDVFPEVKLGTIDGFKIEIPQVTIGEKELNEELETIRERNALVIDCDDDVQASNEHIATVNYSELDKDSNVIEGTEREDFVFTLGSEQNIYKFDKDIIGMKKGETKDITKKYPKDFEDTELAGTTKHIRISLTGLKSRNLPDLDDELAQDVSEKYKTLEELKTDIKQKLERTLETKLKEIRTNTLLEKIMENNDFELPESMIQTELESQWRMMAQQFKTDVEQLEKILTSSGQTKQDLFSGWRTDSERRLKSRVIVEILLKERNIEVSPEELEQEFEKIAEGANISIDEVKNHYADVRHREYLIDDIKEQRLYAQILENCTITKGAKIAFAELFKNG